MTLVAPAKQIDINFKDITFCVKEGKNKAFKTILKGASGSFSSGQLVAILGPSGAGKTTLLNVLTGFRVTKVSGSVFVNGEKRDMRTFKRHSCYIMQEDHLLPFLTVQETMMNAAHFKIGDKVPKNEKKIVVENIIDSFGLKNSVNTRVVNLSGGERKRLSIAAELVNNPSIMFFDEPTSGLDSQNTYYCVKLLKSLAQAGRTVICTIHQPSAKIFAMFDVLYGMADGQCIYRGPTCGLLPALSTLGFECPSYHNPADFLVEIASGQYGNVTNKLVASANCEEQQNVGKLALPSNGHIDVDLVSSSKDPQVHLDVDGITEETKIELEETRQTLQDIATKFPHYPASFCTQFRLLFWRSTLSMLRDMMLTHLRLGSHIVVGLFIGLLYYQVGNEASEVLSNVGYIFFSLMMLLFTALMPTVLTFPLEMDVFVKEHLNNWYSLKAYYFAKTMADLPFQILLPIIYTVIAYFMTGQRMEASAFFLFNFLCIMISLISQSIGLAIGAAFKMQESVFLGPVSAIPPLLFSGFFVTFSTMPVYLRWLTYLSYIRYGFEGALIITYGMDREPLNCSEAFCYLKHPKKVLDQFDMEESFFVWDVILLIVYFLVMRFVGYFVLRWKLRKER